MRSNTKFRTVHLTFVALLMVLGITMLPLFPQSSASAVGVASQKSTTSTYEFKKGADAGSGTFVHTYSVGNTSFKEKIGVMCDATASTNPTFIISYQLKMNGEKYPKQQATIYSQKRVNQICKVTKDGVLVIRSSAIKHPKATSKFLLNIAIEKNIVPFN